MTSATVIGASLPVLKVLICWGTLSSRIRNFSRGILGINRPLLSSTDTSTCTVVTSLLKLGRVSGTSLSFLVNLLGIGACSGGGATGCAASASGAAFFRGLATVSEDCDDGPSWAISEITPPRTNATAKEPRLALTFMRLPEAFIGLPEGSLPKAGWRI